MAAQYWQLAGQPARTLFITLNEAYHGDTVGAASLGYSEPFHRHIRPLLFHTIKIPPPHVLRFHQGMEPEAAEEAALAAARELFDRNAKHTAAPVIERQSRAQDGRVAEVSRSWFDWEKARYVARLK